MCQFQTFNCAESECLVNQCQDLAGPECARLHSWWWSRFKGLLNVDQGDQESLAPAEGALGGRDRALPDPKVEIIMIIKYFAYKHLRRAWAVISKCTESRRSGSWLVAVPTLDACFTRVWIIPWHKQSSPHNHEPYFVPLHDCTEAAPKYLPSHSSLIHTPAKCTEDWIHHYNPSSW